MMPRIPPSRSAVDQGLGRRPSPAAAASRSRLRGDAERYYEIIDVSVERGEMTAERVSIQPPSVEHSKLCGK